MNWEHCTKMAVFCFSFILYARNMWRGCVWQETWVQRSLQGMFSPEQSVLYRCTCWNLKCVAKPNVGLKFSYAFQVVESSAFLNAGKLQKAVELSTEVT